MILKWFLASSSPSSRAERYSDSVGLQNNKCFYSTLKHKKLLQLYRNEACRNYNDSMCRFKNVIDSIGMFDFGFLFVEFLFEIPFQ